MQAMRLKEMLKTDMMVTLSVYGNLLSVGDENFPSHIIINLDNMHMIYTRGSCYRDRSEIKSQKLLALWDELQALIDDGTLHELASKDDVIDNPTIVYRVIDGQLKSFEATGDSYPHALSNGEIIHNNVYFKDPIAALINGYSKSCLMINHNKREINELSERLKFLQADTDKHEKTNIDILSNQLPVSLKTINKADIETIVIPDCMLNLLMKDKNVRIRDDATESLQAFYKKRTANVIVYAVGETVIPTTPVCALLMDNYENGEGENSGVTLVYIENDE